MRNHPSTGRALGDCLGLHGEPRQAAPAAPYRHRYQCWACRSEGVLEFEPDASGPGWTECHYCGIDNEIPAGSYDRPALVRGRVPTRLI